ncbi:hypothetical protein B0H19DRAFT_1176059 [Mycena capillaripes]|nr:hypothetical protein B0H19DRAFT_1176059 [Mycena capillaripes]
MLSIPLSWDLGVIYFAAFIMAFLWRAGATNEPDANSRLSQNQVYGLRSITAVTFIVVVG